jgi:hypothetical protein
VGFVRIGPSREPGYDVELSKKLGDHLVGVCCGGEGVHLGNHPHEGGLDTVNRLRRIVLTLFLKTAVMFHEFFAIELGNCSGGRWTCTIDQESLHTVPGALRKYRRLFQCKEMSQLVSTEKPMK